jgi:hypothetical protein
MNAAMILIAASSISFSGWFGASVDEMHGVFSDSNNGYSITFPDGWHSTPYIRSTKVTRMGWELQCIAVDRIPMEEGLPNTKKVLRENMILPDLSQTYIDSVKSAPDISRFSLVSNKPAQVGGRSAFRIEYSYVKSDLMYGCICYGVFNNKSLYIISYTAPRRHYFPINVKDFEQAAKTFSFHP